MDRRVLSDGGEFLGLTGGYDSRVVALACREIGKPLPCFTWGDEKTPDDPAEIAGVLGLDHSRLQYHLHDGVDGIEYVLREVRWNEGLAPALTIGAPTWPPGITRMVTGAGGETGRAFYYGLTARNYSTPRPRDLARVLRFEERLGGARHEAIEAVRSRTRQWIDSAWEQMPGWRALDVVYAEQRVRRWGRSFLPHQAAAVAAFYTPEVSRGLASLPLADRITSGFHRRFLAERVPELTPPSALAQRRGIPPVARRFLGMTRSHLTIGRARRKRAPIDWTGLSVVQEWYLDALGHPHFAEALGSRWVEQTRAGFVGGNSAAATHAMRAAAYAAFHSQVKTLRIPDHATVSIDPELE